MSLHSSLSTSCQHSLQLVPSPWDTSCWLARDIFTPQECSDLIGRIQAPVTIDTRTHPQELMDNTLRIVDRTALNDTEFASWLESHVRPLLPKYWTVEAEDEHMGPFCKGKWELDGIDPRIQLYRYEPGGIFTKHRDGPIYKTAHQRSFFTVLVYLNVEYEGGNTTIFSEDLTESFKVIPEVGSVFVMLQRTLHEGSKVESGRKFLLRCDVMYSRVEGTLEEVVHGMEKLAQAKKWYQLASILELSGNSLGSVDFYRRAYKLDPDVEVSVA